MLGNKNIEVRKRSAREQELEEALQHIVQACNNSVQLSRRNQWIMNRAEAALRRDDAWKWIDIPKIDSPSKIRRRIVYLEQRLLMMNSGDTQ
jgi:hypothetical protein